MKDNFEFALEFALNAHKGQLDKGWTPYIQHIMGVWSRVRDEDLTTQIVALLHDVPEDTEVSLSTIYVQFGDDVGKAVGILTHIPGQAYEAYIASIAHSGNKSAILVKLADLEDNTSAARQKRLPEERKEYFLKRTRTKYEPAKELLKKFIGVSPNG